MTKTDKVFSGNTHSWLTDTSLTVGKEHLVLFFKGLGIVYRPFPEFAPVFEVGAHSPIGVQSKIAIN